MFTLVVTMCWNFTLISHQVLERQHWEYLYTFCFFHIMRLILKMRCRLYFIFSLFFSLKEKKKKEKKKRFPLCCNVPCHVLLLTVWDIFYGYYNFEFMKDWFRKTRDRNNFSWLLDFFFTYDELKYVYDWKENDVYFILRTIG